MSPLNLEIVEGPGVGLKVPLRRPIVIGRGEEADLVLDNAHTSRAHARITPGSDGHASVEDLGSANGTFVNHVDVHAPTQMSVGDELVIGVSVLTLSAADLDRRATAVHSVPTDAAGPQRSGPQRPGPQPHGPQRPGPQPAPRRVAPPAFAVRPKATQMAELERLLDVNVKFRARMAPLAVLVLVALVVSIYLGAR
jgi:pSer/pThr/pTyr-binding forkhead associated (FHA) protein